MRTINYHIAITLDGFISHKDGSVEGLLMEGPHADEFVQALREYDTVLMGRKTYEFGFQFGLKPGQPAYPNLKHYIFSQSLDFTSTEQVMRIASHTIDTINALKQKSGKEIWLCGGGELVGFLLDNDLIDTLTVKVNPVLFGAGRKLFGSSTKSVQLKHLSSKAYDNGVLLNTYDVLKNG